MGVTLGTQGTLYSIVQLSCHFLTGEMLLLIGDVFKVDMIFFLKFF